jgi:hypothetical protein
LGGTGGDPEQGRAIPAGYSAIGSKGL